MVWVEVALKSTLINHLLQLEEDEMWAEESLRGNLATTIVRSYEKITKRGIKVLLFDTPGFDNLRLSNDEIITMMRKETNKQVHLVLYCISLSSSARVQHGDVRAFQAMQIFSDKLWENTIIVLTFANDLASRKNKEDYLILIRTITDEIRHVLKEDVHVNEEVANNIPIVTAGYTEPKLPDTDKWDNHLFLKALEQIDPKVLPALLETRIDWKQFILGAVFGAIAGALSGAVGSIAGPIGTTIGTAAGVGAVLGWTGGMAMTALTKVILSKYKEWKAHSSTSTTT